MHSAAGFDSSNASRVVDILAGVNVQTSSYFLVCRFGQQQCFKGGGHPVRPGFSRSDGHHHHPPAPPGHPTPHGPHAPALRQWTGVPPSKIIVIIMMMIMVKIIVITIMITIIVIVVYRKSTSDNDDNNNNSQDAFQLMMS